MNSDLITPQELSAEGKLRFKDGLFLEASELFLDASAGFKAAGDELSAAENDNNCGVALVQGGEAQQGLEIIAPTPGIFARVGDRRRQAMALGNMGLALKRLDRFEDAIAAYQQASDLFKQLGERELREPVLTALAELQLRTGQPIDAAFTTKASLAEEKNFFKRTLVKVLDAILKRA